MRVNWTRSPSRSTRIRREIAGAAADIADQHGLAVEQFFVRSGEMAGDPGIEGGGGFFEQRQIFDAGCARGFDREFARFFVEAGRHGQHDMLLGEWRMLRVVPGFAQMSEIARRSLDGRENAAFFLRIPGQNFRGAIGFRIREPRFGGVNGFGGHQRALIARVRADYWRIAQIQKRRQRAQRPRCDWRRPAARWAGRESAESRLRRLLPDRCRRARSWWCRDRYRRSCGGCARSRTLNSSFQRRPSAATHQSSSIPVSVTLLSSVTGTISSRASVLERGRKTSIGASSSSSSAISSSIAPGASFLRESEEKKRNSAGSPTTERIRAAAARLSSLPPDRTALP